MDALVTKLEIQGTETNNMNKTLTNCGISSASETASLLSRYGCGPRPPKPRPNKLPKEQNDMIIALLGLGKTFKEIKLETGRSFGFISKVKNAKLV